MKERLTAAKAAEIADSNSLDKIVDAVLVAVEQQAKAGLRTLKFKNHILDIVSCGATQGEISDRFRHIELELQSLGYEARFVNGTVTEMSIKNGNFVKDRFSIDRYLDVSW